MEETVSKALKNWKIHLLALVLCVIAELIGGKSFNVGPAKLVLVPMLYSFVLGAIVSLPKLKILSHDDMIQVSALTSVTFFLLMARYGTLVGQVSGKSFILRRHSFFRNLEISAQYFSVFLLQCFSAFAVKQSVLHFQMPVRRTLQ